jgi:ABC-type dipeptide/oligopeptide/nickel transport system permease subunit
VFFGRAVVRFGAVIILLLVLMAVLGPTVAPYNPNAINLPRGLEGPSRDYLLGTDQLGRDTLSRIIYGARTSLMVGMVSVGIATVIGVVLGIIAGYYGRWIHAVVMRFIDALMAFPMLLLALMIAALLGGGMRNVIIALTISLIPQYARLMCAQVLSVKENDYISAAKSIGAKDIRILLRHIFSNAFPPLLVQMTLRLGHTILSEATLSFLGVGIRPPIAAWGNMVAAGRDHLERMPILSLAPGLCIMLVVFSFNMVGDGLRDALDPRLRGRL